MTNKGFKCLNTGTDNPTLQIQNLQSSGPESLRQMTTASSANSAKKKEKKIKGSKYFISISYIQFYQIKSFMYKNKSLEG